MDKTVLPTSKLLLPVVAVAILNGCGGSGSGASDEVATPAVAPAPPAPAANLAPEITGTPPDTAVVGESYRFIPQAHDPDGDAVVFSIDNRPIWATFNATTGELSGTPAETHQGKSTDVTITVTDGQDDSNLLPFDLHVEPREVVTRPEFQGSVPVSTVLANTAFEFTPTLASGIYGNVAYSIRNQPSWAEFENFSGRLSGTPSNSDAGTYSDITITAINFVGATNFTPFDLVVIPAGGSNSPPEISGEPATSALVGSEYRFTPVVSDPDGDDLDFAISGKPSWATFNTVTGRLRGTPSAAHVGRTGSISIAVSDGQHTRNLPAFTIDVVEPQSGNSPPQITGTPSRSAQVDQPWSFTPAASDSDGDPLSFSVSGKPAWMSFNSNTGRLSGTPGDADIGQHGPITISVSDGMATRSLNQFSISVSQDNRPPIISGNPLLTAFVGQPYTFTPTASDPDGDTLSFTADGLPAWASLNAETGRIAGTPGAGDSGSWGPVRLSVSDGELTAQLAQFEIAVEDEFVTVVAMATNDGYIKESSPDRPMGEQLKLAVKDNILHISFISFDIERPQKRALIDAHLRFRVRFVHEPGSILLHRVRSPWNESDLTFRTAPAYVADPDRQFSVSASDEGQVISLDVTHLVDRWLEQPDGVHGIALLPNDVNVILHSVESGEPLQLTMNFGAEASATNYAPAVDAGKDQTGQVNEWIQLSGHTSDDGLPNPPARTLISWNKQSGPGNVEIESVGKAVTRVRADAAGTYNLRITADDGELVAEDTVSIVVTRENGAPSITGNPESSATVGNEWSFTPSASDPDGDPLTFAIAGKPTWTTFDPSTGTLRGTPSASDTGISGAIVISVSDGNTEAELPAFSLTVSASNRAPSISGSAPASVAVNASYLFKPVVSDPDGDDLNFTIANKPVWATFNRSTGRLGGQPGNSHVGNYSGIEITVSDGQLQTSLAPFSIAVVGATQNMSPVISGNPPASVTTGQAYEFRPVASDPEDDALTFDIANKPAWADFNRNNGRLSGTPQAGDAGHYPEITISVSDGTNSTALAQFAITVNAPEQVTGQAFLTWNAPSQNSDGTTLRNLAGYRVYAAKGSSAMALIATLSNPGLSSYLIENLDAGTHHFRITAVNSDGAESVQSNRVSKTIE